STGGRRLIPFTHLLTGPPYDGVIGLMLLAANFAKISELETSASDTRRFANTTGTSALSYMEHRSWLVTRSTSAPLNKSANEGLALNVADGIVATYMSCAEPLKITFEPYMY
ncbi:MAG: hypothetical protein KF682_22715, partial [Nitrospira sp.]|nr:hypothetical protein [Nitrospira sp.]